MEIEEEQVCKYDGVLVKERDTVIGKVCGEEGYDIVSWDNRVTLNFYSDFGSARRGFIVNYTAIAKDTIEMLSSK